MHTLGITLGDMNGIGPEVALKAAHRRWPAGTRIVLVGARACVCEEADSLGLPHPDAWEPGDKPPARKISVWDPSPGLRPRRRPGRLTADAGAAAARWIESATDACLDGRLDAMVTAPINKAGFEKAGIHVPGHTELLAARTKAQRFAMMLFGGPLRVVLVTRHLPLREVAGAVTRAAIDEAVTLTHQALPWMGLDAARIAVCGLNPHAGDSGRIGREEIDIVRPAIRRLRRKGLNVDGPFPADTVFHQAVQGEFDAVVAMYHDQGLGPLKTLAFDEGVNLTLGLPIIRTSPDHGTAYGIAGQGIAKDTSMAQAIRTALTLAGRKNPWAP